MRIQIACALIAYLALLRLAQDGCKIVENPLAFARLVRANVMHQRDLDRLFQPPPQPCQDPRQLTFKLVEA